MTVKTADEFYCAMGQLSQEMLQFSVVDSNMLIKVCTFHIYSYVKNFVIAASIIFGKEIVALLLYGLFLECNALLMHQLLTNNQIRNSKCQLTFFDIVTVQR